MADEVPTFKALITIHKVLQEGHPVSVKEAQQNVSWIESLARGVSDEGLRGTFSPVLLGRALTKDAFNNDVDNLRKASNMLKAMLTLQKKATDLSSGNMFFSCLRNLTSTASIPSSTGFSSM